MHLLTSTRTSLLGTAMAALLVTGCPPDRLGHPDGGKTDAGSSPSNAVDSGHPSGMPGASCGSRGQAPCASNQFCRLPLSAQCGAADAPGRCEKKPDGCADDYSPVCGCDGKTYPNDCGAAAAGVSTAHTKPCSDTPTPTDSGTPMTKVCGGLRGATCARSDYCSFAADAQCGAADQTGTCTPRPSVCTSEVKPVCGCDDKTYSNGCEAARAGVSVAKQGSCDTAAADSGMTMDQICGGRGGKPCPANQFCNIPESGSCGVSDASGVCTAKPAGCTKDYRPVCGCDGKTYGNACTAASAGVSIKASSGPCGTNADAGMTGQVCGGLLGKTCPSGQFCDFPESTQCGSGDQQGTCANIPSACTLEYNPVCGCDAKTYGNRCGANGAGVSVQAQGACK